MLSYDCVFMLYTDVQYSDTSFSGHVYNYVHGYISLAVIVMYYAHDFEGYAIAAWFVCSYSVVPQYNCY